MDKAGLVLILRDRPLRRVHNQRPDHVAHRLVATLICKTTRHSLLYSTVIIFATIVFAAIVFAAIVVAAIAFAARDRHRRDRLRRDRLRGVVHCA